MWSAQSLYPQPGPDLRLPYKSSHVCAQMQCSSYACSYLSALLLSKDRPPTPTTHTTPPTHTHHHRLHFPGWFLAGFGQRGHWWGKGGDRPGSKKSSSADPLGPGLPGHGSSSQSDPRPWDPPLWKWFLCSQSLGSLVSPLASPLSHAASH